MRCNANTIIFDRDVVLVPYREEHVAKYHEWMTSSELRELTASEPLTLDEEYEMQRKWQVDEDKLTFIIHSQEPSPEMKWDWDALRAMPMVGDVNLFLKESPEDEYFEAEAEIMIAEPTYRRHGLARAALELLLSYAAAPDAPAPLPVPCTRFVARIGAENAPSIALFEKLGFVVTKRVEVFGEVEMRWKEGRGEGEWRKGERVELRDVEGSVQD
ncbi:predicted protein [Postia placenta Mad-698-R]|nr:predicted protein [Postia placenta Mad-698-R]